MNINLLKEVSAIKLEKGDIIVAEIPHFHKQITRRYLVVEDVPKKMFMLMNMDSNNIMSRITSDRPDNLARSIERLCSGAKVVDIIKSDEFEVVRTGL